MNVRDKLTANQAKRAVRLEAQQPKDEGPRREYVSPADDFSPTQLVIVTDKSVRTYLLDPNGKILGKRTAYAE